MARKNRDREPSREAVREDRRSEAGGIRRTQNVRTVERAIADRRPYSNSVFDLDLSAFSVVEDARLDRAEADRSAPSVAAATATSRQVKAIADAGSKRGQQRKAARIAERRIVAEASPRAAVQGRVIKKGLAVVEPARREHLHAEHSTQSRKETARANCKKRPEKSGRGSGRKFVPWCDRTRK